MTILCFPSVTFDVINRESMSCASGPATPPSASLATITVAFTSS